MNAVFGWSVIWSLETFWLKYKKEVSVAFQIRKRFFTSIRKCSLLVIVMNLERMSECGIWWCSQSVCVAGMVSSVGDGWICWISWISWIWWVRWVWIMGVWVIGSNIGGWAECWCCMVSSSDWRSYIVETNSGCYWSHTMDSSCNWSGSNTMNSCNIWSSSKFIKKSFIFWGRSRSISGKNWLNRTWIGSGGIGKWWCSGGICNWSSSDGWISNGWQCITIWCEQEIGLRLWISFWFCFWFSLWCSHCNGYQTSEGDLYGEMEKK